MCRLFIGADAQMWRTRLKSVRMRGYSTSVRLENFYWRVLEEIARRDGMNLPQLLVKLHEELLEAHGRSRELLVLSAGLLRALFDAATLGRRAARSRPADPRPRRGRHIAAGSGASDIVFAPRFARPIAAPSSAPSPNLGAARSSVRAKFGRSARRHCCGATSGGAPWAWQDASGSSAATRAGAPSPSSLSNLSPAIRVGDHDARHGEQIAVGARQTAFDGERRAVAGRGGGALEIAVENSVRPRQEFDRPLQALLERLLGLREFRGDEGLIVGRAPARPLLVEIRVRAGVRLHVDEAGFHHLLDLRPGEGVGFVTDGVGIDEQRDGNLVAQNDREHLGVLRSSSVVDGDGDGHRIERAPPRSAATTEASRSTL